MEIKKEDWLEFTATKKLKEQLAKAFDGLNLHGDLECFVDKEVYLFTVLDSQYNYEMQELLGV